VVGGEPTGGVRTVAHDSARRASKHDTPRLPARDSARQTARNEARRVPAQDSARQTARNDARRGPARDTRERDAEASGTERSGNKDVNGRRGANALIDADDPLAEPDPPPLAATGFGVQTDIAEGRGIARWAAAVRQRAAAVATAESAVGAISLTGAAILPVPESRALPANVGHGRFGTWGPAPPPAPTLHALRSVSDAGELAIWSLDYLTDPTAIDEERIRRAFARKFEQLDTDPEVRVLRAPASRGHARARTAVTARQRALLDSMKRFVLAGEPATREAAVPAAPARDAERPKRTVLDQWRTLPVRPAVGPRTAESTELDKHYYAAVPLGSASPSRERSRSKAAVAPAAALAAVPKVALRPPQRAAAVASAPRRAEALRPRGPRRVVLRQPAFPPPPLRMAASVPPAAPPLFFWSHRAKRAGDAAALSNWFPCTVEYDGRIFHSSEQAIMHEKARLFGDDVKAAEILAVAAPASFEADDAHGKRVQHLGREVAGFDDAVWAAASPDIAVDVLTCKFARHPALGDFLLSTAPRNLVEASPRDAVWGIGVDAAAAAALPTAELARRCAEGNRLGDALMEVRRRERQRREAEAAAAAAEPLPVSRWRRVTGRAKEARGSRKLRVGAAPWAPPLGEVAWPSEVGGATTETREAEALRDDDDGDEATAATAATPARAAGGMAPAAALRTLFTLGLVMQAEAAASAVADAEARRDAMGAALAANLSQDGANDRAVMDERERAASARPPGEARARAAAAAQREAALAALAAVEVPTWRCVGCTDTPGCGRDLPGDDYSNNARRLRDRGLPFRCRACVAAGSPAGVVAGKRAAEAAARAAAEAAEPARSATERDAAFARLQQRTACRAAGRAAAALAAEAVAAAADGDGGAVLFGGGDDDVYACFALDAALPFVDAVGRRFPTLQHFLAHRRAATFGDQASAGAALAAPNGAAAAAVGRRVAPFEEERWRKYRDDWLDDGLWRVAQAHRVFAVALLGTGDRPLVSTAAQGGDALGVGASAAVCKALPAAELDRRCVESNRHGRALERVRHRLRRARAIAAHRGVVPWQCLPENGGIDWELFADVLECFEAATTIRERGEVCSRTGARWQDHDLISVLRHVPLVGGVEASAAALAELDAGGRDRCAGRNGRLEVGETVRAFGLMNDELEAGQLEGPFRTRAELGPLPIWTHPVHLCDKNKDGKVKTKAVVDFVLGVVSDGEYGVARQEQKRWIDNYSAGKVPARTPDGKRSKSKPALDSINAFSPLSTPCTLDDVRYISSLVLRLKTDGGRLQGAQKRRVEGSAVDVKNAYRNVPIRHDHRRLFCFRFLDVTKPIPAYVLAGGQPREEDLVIYRKTTMPFGWISSVDYWVRISKALKAVHLWDDAPGLSHHIPRIGGRQQHGASQYIDDLGSFAVEGWGETAQARYIELCEMLGVPISQEKLDAEGDVGDVVALLGVLVDCGAEQLRLTPARLANLAARCREVQGKAYVSKKELRNLVGVLSFAASCAPAGRTFMRRLYDAQSRKGNFCRINRGLKCDLAWHLKFVLEDGGWHGASMMIEDFESRAEAIGLYTDASLEGFGASFVLPDGTVEVFSGRWEDVMPGIDTSQETGEWHISELELLVVLLAAIQWRERLAQRRVVMRCDNEAAVTSLNSGKARDGSMSMLLRELWFVKARNSFELRSKHIKTHDNVLGDAPSRWTRTDGTRDAEAEAEFYAYLKTHYGLAPGAVREVELKADVRALLRRMIRAHAAKRRVDG